MTTEALDVAVLPVATVLGGGVAAGAAAGIVLALVVGATALLVRGANRDATVLGALIASTQVAGWTPWLGTEATWILMAATGATCLAVVVRHAPYLPSVTPGAALIGVAPWLIGAFGAALQMAWAVSGQRLAYGALALATLLVMWTRPATGATLGLARGFLGVLAILLAFGAPELFAGEPYTPGSEFTAQAEGRFGGSHFLYLHPNQVMGFAWLATVRLALDPVQSTVVRCSVAAAAVVMLAQTESRTSALALTAALGVGLGSFLLRRRGQAQPNAHQRRQRTFVTVLAAIVAMAAAIILTAGFFSQKRLETSDLTSGRSTTWRFALDDFEAAGPTEILLGDATHSRGLIRQYDGPLIPVENVPLAALRRAGIVGLAAVLVGCVLLFRHVFKRGHPVWAIGILAAALATTMTEERLLAGAVLLMVAGAEIVHHQRVVDRQRLSWRRSFARGERAPPM